MWFQEDLKYDSHCISMRQSYLRSGLLPRCLAMARHIFECHNWGWGCCWQLIGEVRDAAKQPTRHRTDCTTKNDLAYLGLSNPTTQILLFAVQRTASLLRLISLMVKKMAAYSRFPCWCLPRKRLAPLCSLLDQRTFSPKGESKFQRFISEFNK